MVGWHSRTWSQLPEGTDCGEQIDLHALKWSLLQDSTNCEELVEWRALGYVKRYNVGPLVVTTLDSKRSQSPEAVTQDVQVGQRGAYK